MELVEQLVRRGSMARLGVTPLMCGSFNGEYAQVRRLSLLHNRARAVKGMLSVSLPVPRTYRPRNGYI